MPTSRVATTAELLSEVSRYKQGIHLGEREEQFLSLIGKGHNSSYKIYTLIKNAKLPADYKNVNKKVKRLRELHLITGIKGESIHNAKFYDLTPEGLFYLLSDGIFDLEPEWLSKYKDNMILKYLLEPYFDEKTIVVYGIHYEIAKYLKECCQMILVSAKALGGLHPQTHTQSQKKKGEEMIVTQLQIDLEWQAKALAFKLISKKTDLWYVVGDLNTPKHTILTGPPLIELRRSGKLEDTSNIDDLKFRYLSLAIDKKFVKFSSNLGKEYQHAFSNLVESVPISDNVTATVKRAKS
jgi:hypothetical protein